jgi:hypothetical protein
MLPPRTRVSHLRADVTEARQPEPEQLTLHLEALDAELTAVREHLLALDAKTARAMGLYAKAEALVSEREEAALKLAEVSKATPLLPSRDELRESIECQFGTLETVFEEGTVEEKRGLIAEYVHRVEALPDRNTVRISLYPPGVSQKNSGGEDSNLRPLGYETRITWVPPERPSGRSNSRAN